VTNPPRLLIATRNPGKFSEFTTLLDGLGIELLSLRDLPDAPIVAEDFTTYVENATAKACAVARHAGLPALADDSGLEVDALEGGPGVRSARFAGEPSDDRRNTEKLLRLLDGVPGARRTARFCCVVVVALPDGDRTLMAEGSVDGVIAPAPAGTSGFGYDPIFLIPSLGRTFAQLAAVEKHRLSHRARACAQLRARLLPFLRASRVS